MVENEKKTDAGYPVANARKIMDARRRRRGAFWGWTFWASTLIGVLALLALVYNVVDGAIGYAAVQNSVDPNTIELAVYEAQMLEAPNTVESEDDQLLVDGVAENPFAIGFFGFAYYMQNQARLRALTIDDVAPTAEAVYSGDYPISRPLYLYTTAEVLQQRPEVAAFLDYYVENVDSVIGDVGYFPISEAELAAGQAALAGAMNPSVDSVQAGEITIVGSSTVYPITERMLGGFIQAGFGGEVSNDVVGTRAGFASFCTRTGEDIVAASRIIHRVELEECRRARREPVGFKIGNDTVAVVVSSQNTFVQGATTEELRLLFTSAERWSDVNPAWPAEPIARYVPGRDSGTLDYFVESIFDQELHDLPKETLIAILEANVSAGLMRRLENDLPFAERSQQNVYALVLERVVDPKVVRTWSLTDSLLKRDEIAAAIAAIPNAEMEFRNWVSWRFVTASQSSRPEFAGIRTAILGSLWVIAITILFSLPVGVGAAIYLEEYAGKNWFNNLVETNINNLAGVPSIIYGMLGLAIFVRIMEPLSSGSLFGVADPTTANGRTVLSAGLTLGLLILPLIIINAREAVRAVPASLRQAAYALGATKWQTVWNHVLPYSVPGILTGNILAMSRAIGETAPLVVIGAATFIVVDPSGPFAQFTTLPIQIYQWTSRPQPQFRNLAAAAIIVLLILLLSLNAAAVLLRNRYSKQRI